MKGNIMSQKFAIEETKDAITFLAKFGNAIGTSLSDDGKVGFGDLPNFIPALTSLPAAISGAGAIPGELSEISDEERAELIEHAKAQFDIPQDSAEEFVEDTLIEASSLFGYVRKHFLK